jgi:hypothetical protein
MEDRQVHMTRILRTSANFMNWQKDAQKYKNTSLKMRDLGGGSSNVLLYVLMLKNRSITISETTEV